MSDRTMKESEGLPVELDGFKIRKDRFDHPIINRRDLENYPDLRGKLVENKLVNKAIKSEHLVTFLDEMDFKTPMVRIHLVESMKEENRRIYHEENTSVKPVENVIKCVTCVIF